MASAPAERRRPAGAGWPRARRSALPAYPVEVGLERSTPAPYLTEYINRFGEYSTHELGIEPEAYDPKLDVDFTQLRAEAAPAEGFGQAALAGTRGRAWGKAVRLCSLTAPSQPRTGQSPGPTLSPGSREACPRRVLELVISVAVMRRR